MLSHHQDMLASIHLGTILQLAAAQSSRHREQPQHQIDSQSVPSVCGGHHGTLGGGGWASEGTQQQIPPVG